MHMKKREYLQRLTIIMLLLLILPVMLFFTSFRKYTSGKMEQNNEDFYERALETYTSLMDKKIQELEMFAAKISAGSRESNSALHAGGEALAENSYQLYITILCCCLRWSMSFCSVMRQCTACRSPSKIIRYRWEYQKVRG